MGRTVVLMLMLMLMLILVLISVLVLGSDHVVWGYLMLLLWGEDGVMVECHVDVE